MSNFVTKNVDENHVSIFFNIGENEVMAVGEKMESINEEAYMNGYNWEAFLNSYLQSNYPELLEGLDTDSEAGAYVALYDNADVNKADKLVEIINELVENPEKVFSYLENNGEEIEWD